MAQRKLKAEFFVDSKGGVVRRALPLKRSDALAIFQRDGGRCQICDTEVKFGGNTVSPWDSIRAGAIDHIFPRARGGQNNPENLRLACISCNAAKGAK